MHVNWQTRQTVARNLAAALLAGEWTLDRLTDSAVAFLGPRRHKSCRRLIIEILARERAYPPSPSDLAAQLANCGSFYMAARPFLEAPRLMRPPLASPVFAPSAALAGLEIPRLATSGELADWLGLSIEHLDWIAGTRRPHDPTMIPVLQHYAYVFVPKKFGPPRLIESPKPRLKTMQRRILDEILAPVPQHPSVHGFVKGSSALTGAHLHAGADIVIAADLADFFPSTPLRRVHGLFRSLGYPWAVARALVGLVSTATPEAVFLRRPRHEQHAATTRKLYASRHLPQGAPTSPALANLAAWPLDRRLDGLVRTLGATYTRYADDIVFSGDATFARHAYRVLATLGRIAGEEGYTLNAKKTRLSRAHQRQTVTGIVVNAHMNIARDDYDRLKAILHNCVRYGPATQNHEGVADFRAHLDGRVGWVTQVNPHRGRKLRRTFDAIRW